MTSFVICVPPFAHLCGAPASRSFERAASVDGGGIKGINVMNLGVFSDGTVFVPYIDFEFDPQKVEQLTEIESTTWFVTSSDGGVTFTPPLKIGTTTTPKDIDRRCAGETITSFAHGRPAELSEVVFAGGPSACVHAVARRDDCVVMWRWQQPNH